MRIFIINESIDEKLLFLIDKKSRNSSCNRFKIVSAFHPQMIHPIERRGSRPAPDIRFIKESRGALTIGNVMAEDNGKWTCEAVNSHGYEDNARPVKLVVLGKSRSSHISLVIYYFEVILSLVLALLVPLTL